MFGLKTFIGGLLFGGVSMYLAMQFHVINTNDGLIVLPRAHRPPMRSVYVDVRKWSMSMWKQHPEVAESAVRYGRPDLLAKGVLNSIVPQQTSLDLNQDSPTAAEKAKLAMDSLVPIHFRNPKSKPEESATGASFLPPSSSAINFNWNQTAPEQVQSIPVPEINSEVLPNGFPWDDLDPNKFPKLQKPVPFDELESQTRKNDSTPSTDSNSTTDWVKALLNSVVSPDEQASTTAPTKESVPQPVQPNNNYWSQPNHSVAPPRPSVAPINQIPINPLRQPSTRYYPAVRPF